MGWTKQDGPARMEYQRIRALVYVCVCVKYLPSNKPVKRVSPLTIYEDATSSGTGIVSEG